MLRASVALLALLPHATLFAAQVPASIAWKTDVKEAMRESADLERPMLIYWHAEWCIPCQIMEQSTYLDADVLSAAVSFVPVKIDADEGADALRAVAARDDGASRLGELALVDGEGRIGPLGTVFFATLIDENAASHIALGNGYALGVESDDDRARANASSIHVDFMIGSPELDVDGLTADGEAVPLLRGGAWQV